VDRFALAQLLKGLSSDLIQVVQAADPSLRSQKKRSPTGSGVTFNEDTYIFMPYRISRRKRL
jgi:hypothetical protein